MLNFRLIISALFCLGLFISLSSCNKSKKEDSEEVSYNKKSKKALSKKVDLEGILQTELSPKAEEEISDWAEFLSIKSEIDNFPDYTLQKLISSSENLAEDSKSLQDSIPEKFNKTPVQSRINVLYTKTKVLEQFGERQRKDTVQIQETAREIYKTFADLKIQLNEVFIQQLPDFDIKMDQKQDSIQKSKSK